MFLVAGTVLPASPVAASPVVASQTSTGVGGTVRGLSATPIASAHVYAYSLADFNLQKAVTDKAGRFLFETLPAGLYRIVAYKSGFVPAVVALTRPAGDRNQVLDLNLAPDDRSAPGNGDDYWELRSSVPPDVLREIETAEVLQAATPAAELALPLGGYSSSLQAGTGVDDIVAAGSGKLTTGRWDFRGQLPGVAVGAQVDYSRLAASSGSLAAADGVTSGVSLDLEADNAARFSLAAARNRLTMRDTTGETPVELENVRLAYQRSAGDQAQSEIVAQLIRQENFYRQDLSDPLAIPKSSDVWEVAGRYDKEFGERAAVSTGMRYREGKADLIAPFGPTAGFASGQLEAFGEASYRVRPAVLIEYGVYSVLRDGELALSPQGGVVVQLNDNWQLAARASAQLSGPGFDLASPASFRSALFQAGDQPCQQADASCYQLEITRRKGDDVLSLGTVQRELGETMRLYFSSDFFDQSESLYLVPGDRLPELHAEFGRRLSKNVLTRLASSYGAGGGGTFVAAGKDVYENEVRYFITSLDTEFRSTSTGVFVAFHQIEQNLLPLEQSLPVASALASERLQLRVRQDLNVLLDLPADWALQVSMELSRGGHGDEVQSSEVRRRVLGGIAVKF